jgi:hypothetical protein
MTKTLTVTLELPEEDYEKLSQLSWDDGEENSKVLNKLLTNYAVKSDDYLLLERMKRVTMSEYAIVYPKDTFAEYARDQLVDELEDLSDYNLKIDLTKDNVNEFVYQLFERYVVDGTYTYSTYKTNKILSQYYDSIAVSSEWLETYQINPFDNSEAFLVSLLIEYSSMILGDLIPLERHDFDNDEDDDENDTQEDVIPKVIDILKRLSERDLYQIIDGYM